MDQIWTIHGVALDQQWRQTMNFAMPACVAALAALAATRVCRSSSTRETGMSRAVGWGRVCPAPLGRTGVARREIPRGACSRR